MNAWIFTFSLIAITLPFIIAIIIALQRKAKPKSITDYFLYERNLSARDFLKTSVGYSLQAAAIYLFIFWAIIYGISAIFVPIAWTFGYIFQKWAVKHQKLNRFLENREQMETIHGYVGKVANGSNALVLIMAISTILGLGGTLIAEMDYATLFAHEALGLSGQIAAKSISNMAILLFTGLYVLWGGYRAVVETDKFQVPISYVAFGIVLIGVALALAENRNPAYGLVICVLSALTFELFRRGRKRIKKVDPSHQLRTDNVIFGSLSFLGSLAAIICLLKLIQGKQSSGVGIRDFLGWSSSYLSFTEFLGIGMFGVVALLLANVAWQFVDISSLQRLQSVRYDNEEGAANGGRKHIILGLRLSGFEAGGFWALILLLGLGLRLAGLSSAEQTGTYLGRLPGLGALLLPMFLFMLVAFMISTIDGFISATAYVAHYDVLPRNGQEGNEQRESLQYPRIITFIVIFVIYGLYTLVKQQVGPRIDAILYAVWAVQISIGLVIFLALFRKKVYPGIGCASIIAGWGGAFWTVLSEPIFGIPDNSWVVMPPLVAVVASIVVYVIGLGLVKLSSKT